MSHHTLIYTIGAGVGADFNVKDINYGKVIIMTDADDDGAHIQCLLLTFFYRYMRPLIEDGHLYIAMPPLYKVSHGSKHVYAWTNEELKEETKGKTNYRVQRYIDEYYSSEDTFKQVVYFLATCKNMNTQKQEAEIAQIEWVPIEEAVNKITYENTKKLFKQVLEENHLNRQNENCSYLGKMLKIKIDRPLGSKHPKHSFIYPVNYGYVPNTISGDGEELDCYVLGVFEPLEEFTGKCIAIIHRTNDNDDKLIIVPDGKKYTKEQIQALTEFQEQYFKSEIIL